MSESFTHTSHPDRWSTGYVILIVAMAAIQLVAGMTGTGSWALSLAPLIVILSLVSFLWLEAGLVLLAVALYLRIELPWFVGVYPADLLALILIGGLIVRGLTSGWTQIAVNPLNSSMLAVLSVFGLSLLDAHDLSIGITNWLRHAQMFGLIVVTAAVLNGADVTRILRLLLAASLILCVPTIITAIQIGGSQRVFGIASVFFPFFLSTGIIHCSVGYLLSDRSWQRWAWTAMALTFAVGIVVSQTREAMLHLLIGAVLVISFVWIWAGRRHQPKLRRRIAWLVVTGVLVISIVFSGSITIFQPSATRVHQAIEGHSNTIFIRLFMWRMGIQTFLDSPFLGIGIGQIRKWDEFLPSWRFDPMAQVSRGIGAHNDVITYAAETGLAGLAALFVFFWGVVRCGWREWRHADTTDSLFRLLVVWVPCLALTARFFFGTHTFYSLGGLFNCLYFGMLVAQTRSMELKRVLIEQRTSGDTV